MHTCDIVVEFDAAKARTNLRKHCVSFVHAEQALRDARAFTIEDPDAVNERRFVTIGMDAIDRVLVVVHTPRDSKVRIISAREASSSEAKQYYA